MALNIKNISQEGSLCSGVPLGFKSVETKFPKRFKQSVRSSQDLIKSI